MPTFPKVGLPHEGWSCSTRCEVSPCSVHPLGEPVTYQILTDLNRSNIFKLIEICNIYATWSIFHSCSLSNGSCRSASSTVDSFSHSDGESHSGAVTSTRWNLDCKTVRKHKVYQNMVPNRHAHVEGACRFQSSDSTLLTLTGVRLENDGALAQENQRQKVCGPSR